MKIGFGILCFLASATSFGASLDWNGSVSNLWSVAANWTPNAVTQNGDTLTFGAFAGDTTNDLPASNVYSAVRVGRATSAGGDLVRATTEIYGHFYAPVQAMGNVVGQYGLTSQFESTFDVNGYDVSIGGATFNGAVIGTGSIHGGIPFNPGGHLTFNANSTFSGTVINGHGGTTDVEADLGSASFQSGGSFNGVGRTGPLASSESVSPGSGPSGVDVTGILTTGNLTLLPNGELSSYRVDIAGTTPGSGYDQIKVFGSVSIQQAYLQVATVNTAAPGQTFVIVDNDGSDPVSGTFHGLPEGALIQSVNGLASFRISYHGGDGNDVVLTSLAVPSVTMTNSPSSSVTGQAVTLTATVTGSGPTPTGTVSFLDDNNAVLTTATLDGTGHATATFPFVQTTHVYARYEGNGVYGSKTSPPVYQQLNKASTSLSLTVSPNPAGPGQQVTATLQLSITPPGSAPAPGTPSGTYTVFVDNMQIASVNASGTAAVHVSLPTQPAGNHAVTASYTDQTGGSQNVGYQNSSAGPVALHVNATPVIVASDISVPEGNVTATIQVPVTLSGPLSQSVSVNDATSNGTATAGSDYLAAAGSVSFAPGETSKSIPIAILGDTQPEPDEQFTIVFSNASGAALATPQVTVTLTNDDPFFSVISDVQYAVAGQTPLTLDLLIPTKGTGPFPLIVAIEASDWSSPSSHAGVAAREANRGYAVAAIRFRSSDVAKFPAQIADVKAAVRWLRANAALYNLDARRVGVWGIGAGGHLSALLGTSGGDAATDDLSEGNPAYSSRVQAVVDWYGQTDFLLLNAESAGCSGAIDHDAATSAESRLVGCAIQSCSAAARAANPIAYVSGDDPPFLIMHGVSDCLVPAAQSQLLYDALKAAGVDATLRLIDGGHGDASWTAPATLELVDAFFDAKLERPAGRTRAVRH